MEYRTLGRTGIEVSALALGTMMFGAWGNPDEAQCRRMVDIALDAGVNFVDTADVYAFGESETFLGRALAGRRDHVVLATKGHNEMPGDPLDRNRRGNSRVWITRAVEASLRRLGTDHLDLYQVHRPDPSTDIDETLGVLSDLVRAGKIRAIGTSSFPAEALVEAQWVAHDRHRERFGTEQVSYSILARHSETAVLPTAARFNLGVLAWSPLNGGWLTGKYRAGQEPSAGSRALREPEHFDYGDFPVREQKLAAVERLTAIADEAGLPLVRLALGFVLSHPAVTSAIMGPRTPEQLSAQLGAAPLPHDVLDAIDDVVAPGTLINPVDVGYVPPALETPSLRRR
ncbi:aldo/keto reductase [Kineosporia succinea]|uniref:Aryl-alcohol dehydrogenase-like predicted oxidoreductase n=1 Tax=Kineosporia succinea TaxID=84632 RepID=A0ABT9P787_9ACTN|nr:aldo/keto reductase [Kineosporia succinea]MDP9828549.1 aryl-alcohol dehydrogenase-like predicted oxidoreductase [Kineosporia succinea]